MALLASQRHPQPSMLRPSFLASAKPTRIQRFVRRQGTKASPFGRTARPFRHQTQRLVSGSWSCDLGAPKVQPSKTARRRFNPKETHHERYKPKHLPLRYLLWRRMHLRLPEPRCTAVLRVRHAVQVRRCLRLYQELSRAASALPRHSREPAASNATSQCNAECRPSHLNLLLQMRSQLETLALAFIGGIVGAALMDITETYAAKVRISSGVNVGLLGRWALGLRHGQLMHPNIRDARALPGEAKVGWAFHFLLGGGGVALAYPIFLHLAGVSLQANHLLGGLLFGLATSALPWFILLPCFGWGLFGRRGPQGSNAVLAATLSHLPYGLGVGAVIAAGSTSLAT